MSWLNIRRIFAISNLILVVAIWIPFLIFLILRLEESEGATNSIRYMLSFTLNIITLGLFGIIELRKAKEWRSLTAIYLLLGIEYIAAYMFLGLVVFIGIAGIMIFMGIACKQLAKYYRYSNQILTANTFSIFISLVLIVANNIPWVFFE